jgi:hypothetical protein
MNLLEGSGTFVYPVILSAWILGVQVHLNGMVYVHCLRNGCEPDLAWHSVFTAIGVHRDIATQHRDEIEKLNSVITYNNLKAWASKQPTTSTQDRDYYNDLSSLVIDSTTFGFTVAAGACGVAGLAIPLVGLASISIGIQPVANLIMGAEPHRSRNATLLAVAYDSMSTRPFHHRFADATFTLIGSIPATLMPRAADMLPGNHSLVALPALPSWDPAGSTTQPAPSPISEAVREDLRFAFGNVSVGLRNVTGPLGYVWVTGRFVYQLWIL